MTKIYVNFLQLKKRISPLAGIGLLCLLLVLQGQKSFGQRVYANYGSDYGTDGIALLSGVNNPNRAVDTSSLTDFSVLNLGVGLLATVWQNLQYTGTNKPFSSSPVYFRTSPSSGSVAILLNGFKVQRTQNNVGVGQPYQGSQLLDLLGLFGSSDSTYLFLPPENDSFDGIKLTYGGLLNLLGNGRVYYSFFIVSPKVSSSLVTTLCQNSLTDPLSLSVTNNSNSTIDYYLYKDTVGFRYNQTATYNTNTTNVSGYLGKFSNKQIAIANPFPSLSTGSPPPQHLFIIAVDHATSGKFFYSGWTAVTYIIQPPPDLPEIKIQ